MQDRVKRIIQGSCYRSCVGELDFEMAKTLKDGMRLLRVFLPDIVILDLGLPDSRGPETIRAIPSIVDRATVIVLTSAVDPETAIRCLGAGAREFVDKMNDLEKSQVLEHAILIAKDEQKKAPRPFLVAIRAALEMTKKTLGQNEK